MVIVVTYNGRGFIGNCLGPIASEASGIDVLVIDNASADDTAGMVAELFPKVRIIRNSDNLGFGAANNIGLRYAIEQGYDFVYLLNQDAWISPEGINRLVEVSLKHPQYGIVSPLQVYGAGDEMDRPFANRISDALIDDYILGSGTVKEIYPTKNRRSIQAAHWLVRVDVIKKIGGFSPVFFHYGEDANYCNRAIFFGYVLGIVPSVHGVHDRKHRSEPAGKRIMLQQMFCRNILSDPNLTKRERRSKLARYIYSCIPDYGLKTFMILMPLIRDCKVIKDGRKASLSPGAFL